MNLLITGTAGLVGSHVAWPLLSEGHADVGCAGLTDCYDVAPKRARHGILQEFNGFIELIAMRQDADALRRAADFTLPYVIIHLAAQADVSYSLGNPTARIRSNTNGPFNLQELACELKPSHLLLASTWSIYGANDKIPFLESDRADAPLRIYAATTKAMAYSYTHLNKMPTTAFRFFTVYGPWSRSDVASFKFVDAVNNDRAIDVHWHGQMCREFSYIDDLVEGIVLVLRVAPSEDNRITVPEGIDTLSAETLFRLVNIGGGQPVGLLDFIANSRIRCENRLGAISGRCSRAMCRKPMPIRH